MTFTGREGAGRLAFLDWTRGLAATIMLQGHVFHSFLRTDLRTGDAFVLSQFVGGLPPAIFLFLTGVTLAFLMDSCERKGMSAFQRVKASLIRARYLFLLAIGFRVQLWLFAYPQSHWSSLFRVDILNCMALSIGLIAVMAVFTTFDRIRLAAVLGVAIAGISPLVSALAGDAGIHPYLGQYFVPDFNAFGFFPWAAYLAFGVSAGSILRVVSKADFVKVMPWAAWFGVVLVVAGQYFGNIPYSLYPASDFWLNSPALVFIKIGVILLLLSFAFLWNQYVSVGWSWVRQLGMASLVVYWVHTEIVYGRWLGGLKESLTVPQTAGMAAIVIASMVGLAYAKTHWREWSLFAMWAPVQQPRRSSGD